MMHGQRNIKLKIPVGSNTHVLANNPTDSMQPSLMTFVIYKYAQGDVEFR